MRISGGALLVAIAFTVPIVVELRTILAWFGVQISVFEGLVLGLALIAALLVYAFWPEADDSPDASSSS
ncbi:CbaC protein [Natrarchaeobaculum aegyptiacum]|uniref:CbaC protein n=1 Tax=Natrarchaeobaculum aegyptiacum TaxID=745377 RepID=A0A2Z2HQS1_9EURY|nr:CbaC protein [Natrarchaeobaculum aegyptiacum]ARS89342.1 CbaC protein [Natrarchaeobaculum aegyptiacum]